jgi:hypothetical protein
MRYGRALLAGMGWAAPLGAAALCVLVLLAASVAIRADGADAGSRGDRILRLPALREAPAVLLTHPRKTPPPAPAAPRPGAEAGGPPDGGAPPPASARPTPSGSGGGGGGLSR